jgi:hypothetical protein
MRLILLFLVLSIGLISRMVYAEPVIDHIVATEDGYIEIYGKGFTEKKNPAPLVWLDFESPQSSSFTASLTGAVVGTVVLDPKLPSNKVLYFDASVGGSGGPEGVKFDSDELYVSLRRFYKFNIDDPKFSGSSGGLNLKVMRLWASFNAPNNNNFYFGYQGKEGLTSGRMVSEHTSDVANWVGPTAPQKGMEWLSEEMIYKSSNVDMADGTFQYIRNGEPARLKPLRNRTSDKPQRYRMLFLDQVSNYSLSTPLEILYDDIYVDESYHRVVLTDSETPLNYSVAIMQIPVEWRDDYIKVKARSGKGKGVGTYIHVYDKNNRSTKKGARFCPGCPKPPVL